MSNTKIKVNLVNVQVDLPFLRSSVTALVKTVLSGYPVNQVDISFVSKEKICQLHEEFFNDPSPTDCISFPIDTPTDPQNHCFLGEIFVCPATAIAYVAKRKTVINLYEELSLYVVHGLLHLLGYDDIKPKERRKMRRAEALMLNRLRKAGTLISPPKKK